MNSTLHHSVVEKEPERKTPWLDAWHVNPSLNKDYDLIDGLRGIAILLVLVCHLVYFNPSSGSLVHFIGELCAAGSYGVTMFFTLSGFLISWPFWKRKMRGEANALPRGYGWRRFWKIYPPLALSVILFAPIYLWRTGDWLYLKTAGQWLLGIPYFIPVSGKLNPVMWSLVVEVQFYLTLPLLFLALKRVTPKLSLWLVVSIFLIAPVATRWLVYNGDGFSLLPVINVHFPSMMDAFALGILLAGLESMRLIRKSWAVLGDIGFIILIATLLARAWLGLRPMSELEKEAIGWGIKIAAVCLLCYIADPQHPRARMLCQPWLRWFGITSYELYLFHQPLALWTRALFGPADGNVAKYLLILGGPFVTSILITAVVYKYFSLPILKSGREKHSH